MGIPSSCNGNDGPAPPTTAAAIRTWLDTAVYKCWAHESVHHPSTGPHSGEVQTYLNAKLEASMPGTAEHPQGSVAVKEFYAVGGTTITGWAVSVKSQAASAGGDGYYWYETIGTSASATIYEGQGKALCKDCHAGGRDYVLIPFPLR